MDPDTIQIGGKQFTAAEVQKLADAGILFGARHDTLSSSSNAQVPHGTWFDQNTGGLFTRPGAEPEMFSTLVMPFDGMLLARLLKNQTTVITDPEYDILTGVKAGQGSNASDCCGDAPTAGFTKLCTQRAQFGDFFMKLPQITLNKVGQRINRADVDRRLINNPALNPLLPDVVRSAMNPNSTLGNLMFQFGVHAVRVWLRTLFHGSRANTGNNAELGFIREFDGLDQKIKTGHTDLETGNTCPAADSIVHDWGGSDIGATVSGGDIVDLFAGIMYHLESMADDQGLLPTTWRIQMHRDLFWALTQIWPCSYLTNGCNVTTDSGERLNLSGMEQTQMRDEMRVGRFLWINGMRVPVDPVTAIQQSASGAGFSSPVYFTPFDSLGFQTTYVEAFDQENTQIQEFRNLAADAHYRTMNGGLWAMTSRQSGMCLEFYFAAQPRMVMRTPWLAARVENLNYSLPFQLYSRDAYPDGQYFRNGGRYYSQLPSYN